MNAFLIITSVFLMCIVDLPAVSAEDVVVVSVEKMVSVDKIPLVNAISDLEKYRYVLPDYVQSSKLVDENIGNLKIGLGWISVDANVKLSRIDDEIVLKVISGDFKDTHLFVTVDEIDPSIPNTRIFAELSLQHSWHVGILTSFVSDDDLKSMLYTSIERLVEYTKNPVTETVAQEEKFCIFFLCF